MIKACINAKSVSVLKVMNINYAIRKYKLSKKGKKKKKKKPMAPEIVQSILIPLTPILKFSGFPWFHRTKSLSLSLCIYIYIYIYVKKATTMFKERLRNDKR